MLNAIIHGKSGRVDLEGAEESISWRQLYKKREDLLTAAFFSRFTYLSGLMQHRLLKSWLGGVGDFTEFQEAEYWPRYDLPEDVSGTFVEPDLLLRFDNCDVLVEVKPPQGGMQYQKQWEREIAGYFEQESVAKSLYFLAVGKIEGVSDVSGVATAICEKYDELKAIKAIEWKPIAHELHQLQRSHALDAQDHRVVADMLKALELYGIEAYDLKWADFDKLYARQPLNLNVIKLWAQ